MQSSIREVERAQCLYLNESGNGVNKANESWFCLFFLFYDMYVNVRILQYFYNSENIMVGKAIFFA